MTPIDNRRLTPVALLALVGLLAAGYSGERLPAAGTSRSVLDDNTAVNATVAATAAPAAESPAMLDDDADVEADGEGASVAVLDTLTGRASYYHDSLAGNTTASGIPYDPSELVAAHRRLPFGTVLRVTNQNNDRSVVVRVVDRGPFVRGRIIDLSRRAAETIGMIRSGHVPVRVEVLSYGT